MIVFPTTLDGASGHEGDIRAGGTDLQERRHLGLAGGPLVDLRDLAGLDGIESTADGGLRIGAKLRIVDLARAEPIARGYPGLAQAAGGLATPQIRAVATLGGNLLQRNRCWYYRSPHTRCLKSGGDSCLARGGDHLFHACFDLGPCVSVHPSTLGMVALAYEASVVLDDGRTRSAEALFGDGRQAVDHTLPAGTLLTHLVLPAPTPGERAAYFRAISRARSEWPLVEAIVRLVVEGGSISFARVAIGGVAPVPLRLPDVERALQGQPATGETFARAAELAKSGAKPLPMTAYKVDLVEATVLEALERAIGPANKEKP